MYKWEKLGRVFNIDMINDRWWAKEYTQSPSVIVFDEFIRVYFCSRTKPDNLGRYNSYIGFLDLDRNNLKKIIRISENPVLELGGIGTFDEYGTYPGSVVKNGNEIRLYYGGITRCETVPFNAAIGGAVSHDNGETFTKFGVGPTLSYSIDEPFVVGSPKIRFYEGKWYIWYASGKVWNKVNNEIQPVYKIRGAISDDGYNWKKIGHDLLETVLEENECQASADVIFDSGIYHMFFSYRYNYGFKTPGRGYRSGYATSTDLINWTRNDDIVGFEKSESGWDSESVSYSHVFKIGDEIFKLYQGNYMGIEGIGLAKLIGKLDAHLQSPTK